MIDRLLTWLSPKLRQFEIKKRDGTDLYLLRHWLLGAKETFYALMLHLMLLPDDDSCAHSHPWNFVTLVLWGGYVEEITQPDGTIRVLHMRPGMIRYRSALHTHRIASLPRGRCWTLVFRGRRQRDWGFLTPVGEVYWETFIKLRGAVSWCEGWARKVVR